MNIEEQFKSLIEDIQSQTGKALTESKEELARYGAERSTVLAAILDNGEPGFDQALVAARDNMALKAGLVLGDAAGKADGLWMGAFAGALRFAAVALAGV